VKMSLSDANKKRLYGLDVSYTSNFFYEHLNLL